ncbi:MAG TPA: ABC transporter permease [bacterium]|jgi:ABC-2 type transport system permease protein|nr:ABC transporter permease [bacterium]
MFERIRAVLLQELYITRGSLEIVVDLFYTSLITVVVFGFVSGFLTGVMNPNTGSYLILGMLLWDVIRVNQYSITVGSLWNIWSHNLSNMFVAPLSLAEYVAAHMLSGLLKTLVIFGMISTIAAAWFHFQIWRVGVINLALFFTNLTIFAWAIGLVLLGVVFLIGTRIQALAWGAVFIFQPLSAAFFPLRVLPPAVRTIAYGIPATWVFEGARRALVNPAVDWTAAGIAFGENMLYLGAGIWAFYLMWARSRETGQFARNDG